MKLSDRLRLVRAAFSTGDDHEKAIRLAQEGFWLPWGSGISSKSGQRVNLDSAMKLSAFYAGIRVTAQAIAGMGAGFYEKQSDGSRQSLDSGDFVEVLKYSPNRDQTPLEFWEGNVAWILATGNSFGLKESTGTRLSAILPIPSNLMQVKRNKDSLELEFHFTDRGKVEIFPREKIFHLKGFGFGGDEGLSAIRYGVDSIGAAISTDEAAAKVFESGLSASGFISSDNILNAEQRTKIATALQAYSGSKNAGRLMVLEAGMKYNQVVFKPEEAQMLESRRFNIEEVCRWIGIPPIIVGHSAQGQTMWGSGVEQIMLAWMQLGLNPIARRIEARVSKEVIPAAKRRTQYLEFNRETLLQMDSKSKAQFLSQMTQNAIMTRNEARSKLNLPRMEGADQLTAQTALAPLETLGESNG